MAGLGTQDQVRIEFGDLLQGRFDDTAHARDVLCLSPEIFGKLIGVVDQCRTDGNDVEGHGRIQERP